MADPQALMAATAVLILLGVMASKVSDRLGVPAVLLFLVIGMLAGSEGIGGIEFDDFEVAQAIGVVALAFILFAGGLDTEWRSVRPVVGRGVLLATVGVLVTALVTGVAASWVLGVSLTAGLLLGAIVSSTDAAAVFAVLRSQSVSLKGELRPLLELESGSNDPMAVFLTIGFLELLTEPGTAVVDLVPVFVVQMSVGAAVGYALARVSVMAMNRLRLGYEGLYPVVLIAVPLLTYGAAALLGGPTRSSTSGRATAAPVCTRSPSPTAHGRPVASWSISASHPGRWSCSSTATKTSWSPRARRCCCRATPSCCWPTSAHCPRREP